MESVSYPMENATVNEQLNQMKRRIGESLYGLDRVVDELFIALIAKGHILLEDVPGVGKTALAKAFASELGLSFHRIQCTPDLLPADVVGGLVFHPKDSEFVLRKGPIFANIVLVDEINRALPRTQSALLEAMAEGQVTIDGESHVLPRPFLVIATQNPIESQGVFPLPEAQLDRFLLKTRLGYPEESVDLAIMRHHLAPTSRVQAISNERDDAPGSTAESVLPALERASHAVTVTDDVLQYISSIIRATRTHPDIEVGASPRAMILLAQAARAAAVIAGRDFVTPDDVQRVAPLVLFHRLVFQGQMLVGDSNAAEWTQALLTRVEVPIEAADV